MEGKGKERRRKGRGMEGIREADEKGKVKEGPHPKYFTGTSPLMLLL